MGDIREKIIQPFRGLRHFLLLIFRLIHDRDPLTDDIPSQEAYHGHNDEMKKNTGDRQAVKDFSHKIHCDQIVQHRKVVSALAQCDQPRDPRGDKDQDQDGHQQSEIERAGHMCPVEKGRHHHEKCIDPYPCKIGKRPPDMDHPADDDRKGDQNKSPHLPLEKQRFGDEQNGKNCITA